MEFILTSSQGVTLSFNDFLRDIFDFAGEAEVFALRMTWVSDCDPDGESLEQAILVPRNAPGWTADRFSTELLEFMVPMREGYGVAVHNETAEMFRYLSKKSESAIGTLTIASSPTEQPANPTYSKNVAANPAPATAGSEPPSSSWSVHRSAPLSPIATNGADAGSHAADKRRSKLARGTMKRK